MTGHGEPGNSGNKCLFLTEGPHQTEKYIISTSHRVLIILRQDLYFATVKKDYQTKNEVLEPGVSNCSAPNLAQSPAKLCQIYSCSGEHYNPSPYYSLLYSR